ncbi:hypothetical protein A7982_13922 [Minicystis rosea]|nr:hypothetical protein A7982_13922 [Minicystis rosea]
MTTPIVTSAPTPTLDVQDEDVFLGEEILFRRGLACAQPVPALELSARSCRLVVRGPDGLDRVHPREPSGYDGPSRIRSLQFVECLNDLAAPLVAGTYEIAYQCEGREARRRLHVHERATPGPVVALRFPDQLDVEHERPFTVHLDLTNASGAPLGVVLPDICYAASVVGFVSVEEPPSWSRLVATAARAATQNAGYRTPIDVAHRSALSVVLAPGERRSCAVVFEAVFEADLDPEWRPRERFDVTVGLVVHTFEPDVARPLRWLRRSTGTYLTTGALVSTGDARRKDWEWVRVSPSRA